MHLSDLKFEVPQARTACTLRLQNSSNNIKNDILLRKEDFLLKRQTKGIRLTEIFKNLAKNTLSEHTSGAEEEQHFFYLLNLFLTRQVDIKLSRAGLVLLYRGIETR